MSEIVFLNESNVTVTNARFIVNGQTYALSGITSVKNRRHIEYPSRLIPIILGIVGIFFLGSKPLIGLVMIAIAVLIWVYDKKKITDTVILSTAGGEVEAISSENTEFIAKIISALNEAIVYRG